MSAGWPLFIVTRAMRCRQSLRRYVGERKCEASGVGYCNAETPFAEDAALGLDAGGYVQSPEKPLADDPRWPVACACGYHFGKLDNSQVAVREYYGDANGDRWTEDDLPPGAMFELWWWPERGPNDEPWWAVILPGGDRWDVFGLATNSRTPWKITGTAPKFTASPSIASPRYHGWLRDGVLTPDCEGRTYG